MADYCCMHGRLPAPCPECTTELERAIRDAAEHPPAAAQLAVTLAAAIQKGDHAGVFALVRTIATEAGEVGRLEERMRCLRLVTAALAAELAALSATTHAAHHHHAARVLGALGDQVRAGR